MLNNLFNYNIFCKKSTQYENTLFIKAQKCAQKLSHIYHSGV